MAQNNPIVPAQASNVKSRAQDEVKKFVNGTNLQDKVAMRDILF